MSINFNKFQLIAANYNNFKLFEINCKYKIDCNQFQSNT